MFKQLKYFQSVVRLNSFSEAAEGNYISQSAISQQIQALERELGFKLFERMCRDASKIANGDPLSLRIGYLRCYSGSEFQRALDEFSARYPDVSVAVEYGNHEELYAMLRTGQVDIVLNDQRRAFSDGYVNMILTTCESFIEISAHSPLAQLPKIMPQELKNLPCILVTSA